MKLNEHTAIIHERLALVPYRSVLSFDSSAARAPLTWEHGRRAQS